MYSKEEYFIKVFQSAMELCILGLYEKEEKKSNLIQKDEYVQSPLLKKALDKFSLLNYTYSLSDSEETLILPTNEVSLIETFNFPIKILIDRLPEKKRQKLVATDWYMDDAYVSIGSDRNYYCTPELLDKLNERIYRKAIKSSFKELELKSQKFIELLFERNKDEYVEIRNFFQQKEHAYITGSKFIESDVLLQFKKKYLDIFEAAYQKLMISNKNETTILKVCDHCGLVLKEMQDEMLYCVSDRCAKKTKGFTKYKEIEVGSEELWVLRQNVARFIYYPGILEQHIKEFLIKENYNFKLWPDWDKWDFEITIDDQTWVVDAKDVKKPNALFQDILLRENEDLSQIHRVLYVVPSDRSSYVDAVNRMIQNKEKIKCLTFPDFKKMMKEMQVIPL